MVEDVQAADPGTSAILHGMLSTLSEVLGGLEKRLDSLDGAVIEVREAVRSTSLDLTDGVEHAVVAAMTGLVQRVEAASEKAPDARAVESLAVAVAQLQDRIIVIEESLDRRAGDDAARQDRLAQSLEGAVAAGTARVEHALSIRHDAVADALDETAAQLGKLESTISGTDPLLTSIEELQTATGSQLDVLSNVQTAIEAMLAHAERGDPVMHGRLDALTARVAAADPGQAQMAAKLDEVAQRLDAAIAGREAALGPMSAKLEVLVDGMTALTSQQEAERDVAATHVSRLEDIRSVVSSLAAAVGEIDEGGAARSDEVLIVLRQLGAEHSGTTAELRSVEASIAQLADRDVRDDRVVEIAGSVGSILEGIRDQTEAAERQGGTLAAMQSAIEALVTGIEATGPAVEEAVAGLRADIAGVANISVAHQRSFEQLREIVHGLATDTARLEEGRHEPLAALHDGVGRAVAAAAEARDAADLHRDALVASMTSIEGRLAELAANIDALPAPIDPAPAADALRRDLLGALGGSVDTLRAAIAADRDAGASEVVEVAARVDETVTSLERTIAAAFGEAQARDAASLALLSRLADVLDATRADADALEDALRVIVASLDRSGAVTGQVADLLLENRAALKSEIDRLDGSLRAQVETIAARAGSTEQLVVGLDARLSQVRGELPALLEGLRERLAGDPPARPVRS